ncbi:hypothetical protein [Yinghuangia sp. YIM S09857]|uniref:hypothetical protein n=1 Tax=Yinghuangia sp. YIM S09857 TaxID=3436929 RepID=UPI003F537A36
MLLVEVDRGTEPVGELAAKARRYVEWFELLAPKVDAKAADAARLAGGAGGNGFRLWSRVYPATGHEGYPPLAFVFTGTTYQRRQTPRRRRETGADPLLGAALPADRGLGPRRGADGTPWRLDGVTTDRQRAC